MSDRVDIKKLPTGAPGLDEVLGGGLPELSFNLLAGPPGGGKTTLAHQIMFANASPERPALFITICGEPPLKMLRYQQQFTFFDASRIPGAIRFLHLGADLLDEGLEKVLATIVHEVETTGPKLVFVDSFRAMSRQPTQPGHMDLQRFVERLSLHLTSWEATTFLIGEYDEADDKNPIFTLADGIVRLSQVTDRNSIVRKVQVVKMRGQGQIPGLHTVKISDAGLRVYPRLPSVDAPAARAATGPRERRKTGIAGLDEMLGGGVPAGYSMMIVGPSGTGKTVVSMEFIREGIRMGEPGVIAVFEKRPEEYLGTLPDPSLDDQVRQGHLRMLYLRPLDLSVDETMEELGAAVRAIGAKRVVIDSLSGLELALAPSFRQEFRESLYRMVGALVRLGVTVVMTAELTDSYTELRLSSHGISFLTDALLLQRYVEVEGELRRFMVVVKLRGFDHDKRMRFYEVGPGGLVVGEALAGYEGLLVGRPRPVEPAARTGARDAAPEEPAR